MSREQELKKLADAKMQELIEMMENNSRLNQELLARMDRVHEKILAMKAKMENPRSLGE